MGEHPQGSLSLPVLFLDENHCRNAHLIAAILDAGLRCEALLDHFPRGTSDTDWLPFVGERGWCLLTTDASIRRNFLEREAVRTNAVRMFYFSRNDMAGKVMGEALVKALPAMLRLARDQPPPFFARISKSGEVTLSNF